MGRVLGGDAYRIIGIYGRESVLKGVQPSELPVQAPTKFGLVCQSPDRQGASASSVAAIGPGPRSTRSWSACASRKLVRSSR